jgi:type I restriction enzyme S subunit
MSFSAYEEYKDSGIEWLGEVPEHWDVSRCRRLFEIKKEIAGELGYDVFSITQNGFRIKDIESGEGQLSMDYSKYQLVHPGQFAMNPMDLITGGADIAQSTGVTSPDYRVFQLRPNVDCYPPYLLRVFQNCYRNKIFWPYGRGSAQLGRWRFPRRQFDEFSFPVPPLPEQTAIASFLDSETSKIDSLVSEQRRLIELLKEKRQAVISHAVTKGLDPSVPMKDSGIEWLGDVPEHWEVTRVGFVASVARGTGYQNVTEVAEDDNAIRMIRISDFNDFDPVWVRNSETLNPYIVDSTDLLIAGTGASAGITMKITDDMAGMIHSYNAPRIRCRGIVPEFLFFVLNSQGIFQQEDLLFTGSAQHFLDLDAISKLEFPVCGENEQHEIVSYLRERLGKLDSLVAQAERAIELLQERRTALISAAVTGKIDVREFATEVVA